MDDEEYGTPPPAPIRSIDVELGGQEIVAIDLDNLDHDPTDYIELLLEGNVKVSMWTRLSCEYWKKGLLNAAQKCLEGAVLLFRSNHTESSLPPIYQLLANIQLARARKAPKIKLDNPRQDDMTQEKVKETYHQYAAQQLNSGDGIAQASSSDAYTLGALLTRGIYHLAHTELDDAFRAFEAVLSQKPTNVVALLGRARIAYARKQYSHALRLFQQVLQLSPDTQPDPRIGIGLCFWATDQKAKAKACWERSLEVNPSSWAASLLLGLQSINSSKNPDEDDDDRTENLIKGTKYCERAFNSNNRNAAAANALFEFFLRKGDKKRALKLAERTIQFAETLTLFSAGHIHAGHLAQMDGSTSDAMRHFGAALKGNPKNTLAAIGLAQIQVKNDEIPAAIHNLDSLMQPPNPQRSLEAMVMLASLRAYPRPGVSSADAAIERQKARDLFEHVLKALDFPGSVSVNGNTPHARSNSEAYAHRKAVANFGDDVELLVEVARLWQDENRPRMRRVLEEAVRIVEARANAGGTGDPRLQNNFAVLRHLDGELTEARTMYETALTEATAVGGAVGETMATTILYNLARVYEDEGEVGIAKDAYDKLLSRHPEYADAKVRQAQLLISASQYDEAHELLKSAMTSQKSNLNIRAALAHFLASRQQLKLARDIVTQTLSSFDSHDVYSLCAVAWVSFHQARENRDPSQAGKDERRKLFLRAAELYERALQYDQKCAVAAQGLAIITAEDALSPLRNTGSGNPEEAMRRVQGAREALDVFTKVRESINDSSVYVNMGHCYFLRDEYDKAIESYETAAKRTATGPGPDVTVLHCLCRAWYAKANKDQSFLAIGKALTFAQRALHLAPQEKANVYNVAMIEQKAAEMLFAMAPAKRMLVDLKIAVQQGKHANELFKSLAADNSPNIPYSRDIADQRKKYGDSLMRRGDEHLAEQEQYEAAQEARLAEARQKRQDEKARAGAAEKVREEELQQQARALAEERRKAREEVQQWTALMGDSDEEKEKKPRKGAKKQQRSEVNSGDEAPTPSGEGRKKRKGKLRKDKETAGGEGDGSAGEEEALFSGEEVEDRPKKRAQKKRVVRDDDEEAATFAPRKKQFKSKETISDSDEEMS
ncbi:TPR-like protein [Phellopilus nigrolimitatus]|nr:TPR-like protein [Phellopilus nigrolimitatus]